MILPGQNNLWMPLFIKSNNNNNSNQSHSHTICEASDDLKIRFVNKANWSDVKSQMRVESFNYWNRRFFVRLLFTTFGYENLRTNAIKLIRLDCKILNRCFVILCKRLRRFSFHVNFFIIIIIMIVFVVVWWICVCVWQTSVCMRDIFSIDTDPVLIKCFWYFS